MWGDSHLEKRGLFERVFGGKKEPSGHFEQFRLLNSWQTTFTPFSGNAWDVGTVRSAVDSFARNAAKLTARHIRRGDGTITNVNGHLDRLLQFQPNPYMTAYAFFYKVAADYKISNNAIIYKMYDNTGKITGFYPVNASAVELLEKNNVLYARLRFSTGKSYICEYTDLIHIRRHFHDNDIFGSRNGALLPVLETANKFNQSMSKFAELVAIIRGILKVQDSTKDADLKKRRDDFVRDNLMESNNGSGIIVTDRKYDYTNLDNKSTPIPQGQLAYIKNEIYDYYGTNENIVQNKFTEDDWNAFYEGEIEPFAIQLSQAFTNSLFTDKERGYGNEILFEANRLQYASITTKVSAGQFLTNIGAASLDMILEIFNMAPIGGEEGARRVQTLNMVNSEKADDYQLSGKGGGENGGKENNKESNNQKGGGQAPGNNEPDNNGGDTGDGSEE